MATMTTGNWGKILWPGLNAIWGKAYDEYPVEYTDLFDVHASRKHMEEDLSTASFGLASTMNEAAGVSYDEESQGFVTRYTHTRYGLGFIISKVLMDDDLYDAVGERKASGLAFSMRQTKETVCANVYNRATNGSYVGGDGVTLLNTAHPLVKGGTFANKPSVDVDLSEAALEQAVIDIAAFVNDANMKIAVRPDSLIIPPALLFDATRILNSDFRAGTSNNDINAIKSMGMFPKGIKVNHYLTDSDAWFVRTNAPHGMKVFEREKDAFTMDNDFDTDNAKFKATMRFSAGWTDPRGLYGSTGA